jgi:Zn-dependent protease with chaperone function
LAFLWWNRACEYSADRAGLLACGDPQTAISALIKLVAGTTVHTRADLERALRVIETEDDSLLNNLGETLATHPMIIKRIEHLRRYATSDEYRRLQSRMNQNVVGR